jgi:hypothetical protein
MLSACEFLISFLMYSNMLIIYERMFQWKKVFSVSFDINVNIQLTILYELLVFYNITSCLIWVN